MRPFRGRSYQQPIRNTSKETVMLRQVTRLLSVLALLMSVGTIVFAQVNTASLTGLVTDPSGAAAVGAKVIVTSVATNLEFIVTTDSAGYYTFPSLPLGNFTV